MGTVKSRQEKQGIVIVAYRLWSQQGEASVTMRAVARAARTTTPTLCQRFRNKKDLKHFLEDKARQKLYEALEDADSVAEICRRTLKFSSEHSHEYRLLATDWGIRYSHGLPMRSFDFLRGTLAKELGSSAGEHEELAFQVFALVHGTAMLRPADTGQETLAERLEEACLNACAALLREAVARRKRNQ
jgi:AcrR family transcriptional regulator